MRVIDREIEQFVRCVASASANSHQKSTKCNNSLLWFQKEGYTVDCTRFLLFAHDLIMKSPGEFSTHYDNYWEVYGVLIGELLSRVGKTDVQFESRISFADLDEKFENASADQWEIRIGIIGCLHEVAKHHCNIALNSSDPNFNLFWNSLERFLTYLSVSLCAYPSARSLTKALDSFVKIFGSIGNIVKMHERAIADKSGELPRRFTSFAYTLLLGIQHLTKTSSDLLDSWRDALSNILDVFPKAHQSSEVQGNCTLIAELLRRSAEAERNEKARIAYESVLNCLLPKLHGRSAGGIRRKMLPHDTPCKLHFISSGNKCIIFKAEIRNVCKKRCRGFCIEVIGVRVRDRYDKKDTACKIESFPCQKIEMYFNDSDKPETIDTIILEGSYTFLNKSNQFRFECGILRAWPIGISGTGCGLAVLSHPSSKPAPLWKEYVQALTDTGRYETTVKF